MQRIKYTCFPKKNEISTFLTEREISNEDGEDEIQKGNALIRHYFKISPESIADKKWAELVQEALWLKRYEMRNLAELVSAMFSSKK